MTDFQNVNGFFQISIEKIQRKSFGNHDYFLKTTGFVRRFRAVVQNDEYWRKNGLDFIQI